MALHPATEKAAPEDEDPRSRESGLAGGAAARGVSGAVGVWMAGVRTTVAESMGAGLEAEEGGAAGEAEGVKHRVSTLLNLAVRSVTARCNLLRLDAWDSMEEMICSTPDRSSWPTRWRLSTANLACTADPHPSKVVCATFTSKFGVFSTVA